MQTPISRWIWLLNGVLYWLLLFNIWPLCHKQGNPRIWVLFVCPPLSLTGFISLHLARPCLWVPHRLVTWPPILPRRICAKYVKNETNDKKKKRKKRQTSEEESTGWCFNVMHLRQWWEITPHGVHTHTHTHIKLHTYTVHTHTHIWLWGVWNQISPNLYSGVTELKTQTQMITARTYPRAHYMHARLHICKHARSTHTRTHAHTPMQMHTWRGNPGRFISGGLQHSGCLSHFIGHRGRTGMGLFKSNPARPTHTYADTRMHTRARAHTHTRIHTFCLAA